jgi:hypothetical protein
LRSVTASKKRRAASCVQTLFDCLPDGAAAPVLGLIGPGGLEFIYLIWTRLQKQALAVFDWITTDLGRNPSSVGDANKG